MGGGLALALLAGCGSAVAAHRPEWVPQRSPSAIALPTAIGPGGSGAEGGPGGGIGGVPPSAARPSTTPPPTGPTPSRSAGPAPGPAPTPSASSTSHPIDPNVVATTLDSPTGVAVLPDGAALVGERRTGRILLVQARPGQPVRLVKTLTGLSTRGGGGLLDLALSPTYTEDGLVLALITTARDTRVVHFSIAGPVTSILTGIPRGRADNTGRLSVGADGLVLVGTGDGGRPSRAADPASLAGKVLRVDELGRAAPGNPASGSRVYTSGHRTVNGLCTDRDTGLTFEVEAGRPDELNLLTAAGSYGWPGGGGTPPFALPTAVAGVGDCAVANGYIYVTGLGGHALFRARLGDQNGIGTFTTLLLNRYGRLLSVVAAPDGSLWITTSNRDGHGTPVADDERVLHITPSGDSGAPPV